MTDWSAADALEARMKAAEPQWRTDSFGSQSAFIDDPATFVDALCSRRAGKSRGLSERLLKTAVKKPRAPVLYFTLTRKDAKRIMWEPLLELNQKYALGFEPIESELVFKRNGRARIYLTGCDNQTEIGKMRGSGWGDVAGDEAQLFPSYIKPLVEEVLTPALMDFDGSIRLAGTPGPVPSGYFFDVVKSKGWSHHAWTCWDNPHVNAKAIYEKAKLLRGVDDSDPGLQREFFGRWVYDPNALVFRFQAFNAFDVLPSGEWETVVGVDLGFEDADAIAVLGFAKDKPEAHLREESVLPKQTISDLAARLADVIERHKPIAVVADTGGLGKKIVVELQRRFSLPIKAAEKARKFEYIELLNDALRSRRFFAPRSSKFASDCMLVEWDKDKSTNDHRVISDRYHSDVCDAVLYAFRESLHWLHEPKLDTPAVGSQEWFAQEEARLEEAAVEQEMRKRDEEAEWQ